MKEKRREPEVPEERVPVVERLDGLARITLEELAITHFVKNCTLQNACSARPRVRQVEEQPSKRSKTNGDKSAVAMLKKYEPYERTGRPVVCDSANTRQLGCVFQDMEPPKSSSILRKSSDIRKPIRCVKFKKAVARHAYVRDQNPSLGLICPGEPHQRSANAPKFEDRSQEETECSKIKVKNKATFFSLLENRCLPASTLKPEEREFVVDSGASMHMISKKDLNSAEMDTLTKSCSPTIVITANGVVQTNEEATVYVGELDIFLMMKLLENTPAVLSLGNFAMKTDIPMSGSTVKNHISLHTGFGYSATRITSFRSWFQACQQVLPPVLISQPQGFLVYFTNYNSIKRQ